MKKIGKQITYEKTDKTALKVVIQPFIESGKMMQLKLWSYAWTLCGLIIITSLFTYGYNRDEYVMVGIFLIFWGYFEYKVIYALRWNLKGQEVIELDGEQMMYTKFVSGRGLPQFFDLKLMKHFVYNEATERGFFSDVIKSSWFVGGEVIQFGYDDAVKSLGMKLQKNDANQLVILLNKTAGFNA